MRSTLSRVVPLLFIPLLAMQACSHKLPTIELSPTAYNGPIVDVHTHTFNSKYLPIKGIILGKRDANLITRLLPNGFSCELADTVTGRTKLSSPSKPYTQPDCDYVGDDCRLAGLPVVRIPNQFLIDVILRSIGDYKPDDEVPLDQLVNPADAIALQRIASLGVGLGHDASSSQIARFLGHITADDEAKSRHYQNTYGNRVHFHVSHMMDLAPVYAQEEDGVTLLPFEQEQIPRVRDLQNRPDAKHVYFVAYNPFRDHWPEKNQHGKAFEIVRNAIEHEHAYGIKIYPPSGYRPAENEIPDRPFTIFTKSPRTQHDARYKHTNRDILDAQLDQLLGWCEAENIPVFTHAGVGEFEARRGYGQEMPDPKHWAAALKKHPNLRLCFGHSGGERHWFGKGHGKKKFDRWGELIAELCREYPNVYCEFGAQSGILEPEGFNEFVRVMHKEIATMGKFNFADKAIFGTDFFMPSSLAGQTYLDAYIHAFDQPKLKLYARQFFYDNAIAYLNVKQRVNDNRLPSSVRSRLAKLLAQ